MPPDVTVADLDRVFARRTVRTASDGTVRRVKRSRPGGPYRMTFAQPGSTSSRLGRVVLAPSPDGRSLTVRVRDSAGRIYDGLLDGLAVMFVVVGVAMAPLDDWHLRTPVSQLPSRSRCSTRSTLAVS